jgi:cytochrome c biogenesis protein ResB
MTVAATRVGYVERASRRMERALRLGGGPRLGAVLLVLAGAANVTAALVAPWRGLLDSPAYLLLVGTIVLSGMATVGVRSRAAWREWRSPAPLPGGSALVSAYIAAPDDRLDSERLEHVLRKSGYRLRRHGTGKRWQLSGVRHGWSRFAGIASHLSIVVLVVGAAIGSAFAEETRFGLFPGEQSFLAQPRPGVTAALRFDALDAAFDDAGRPLRFDTHVTLVDAGTPVASRILRVNEPADFAGYLVHAWTYGPAVAVKVTDLGGGVLFDGWVALGGASDSSRAPFVELPQLGTTIGFEISDAATNELAAIAADKSGRLLGATNLQPGERARLADVTVGLERFGSYVTFMSRSDPGVLVLFAGAALLCASLAAALYWPRRRMDLTATPDGLRLRVRGERFDDPQPELERLSERISGALS